MKYLIMLLYTELKNLGSVRKKQRLTSSGIIGKITTPEQHTPAGPELQAKLNQIEKTAPTPVSKGGVKLAGKYAKFFIFFVGRGWWFFFIRRSIR